VQECATRARGAKGIRSRLRKVEMSPGAQSRDDTPVATDTTSAAGCPAADDLIGSVRAAAFYERNGAIRIGMALDCILAVRLSAAFDCLTPATPGTYRDPKTRGSVTSTLHRGVISILRLQVGAELARRGLDPDDPVTITIEPDELIPGRRASRARVIAPASAMTTSTG